MTVRDTSPRVADVPAIAPRNAAAAITVVRAHVNTLIPRYRIEQTLPHAHGRLRFPRQHLHEVLAADPYIIGQLGLSDVTPAQFAAQQLDQISLYVIRHG